MTEYPLVARCIVPNKPGHYSMAVNRLLMETNAVIRSYFFHVSQLLDYHNYRDYCIYCRAEDEEEGHSHITFDREKDKATLIEKLAALEGTSVLIDKILAVHKDFSQVSDTVSNDSTKQQLVIILTKVNQFKKVYDGFQENILALSDNIAPWV